MSNGGSIPSEVQRLHFRRVLLGLPPGPRATPVDAWQQYADRQTLARTYAIGIFPILETSVEYIGGGNLLHWQRELQAAGPLHYSKLGEFLLHYRRPEHND